MYMKSFVLRVYYKPVVQTESIETETVSASSPRIISVPLPRKSNGTSMRLEARLLLPDGDISEDTKVTVESLYTSFRGLWIQCYAKGSLFENQGRLGNLTNALAEARKEIIPLHNNEARTKEPA